MDSHYETDPLSGTVGASALSRSELKNLRDRANDEFRNFICQLACSHVRQSALIYQLEFALDPERLAKVNKISLEAELAKEIHGKIDKVLSDMSKLGMDTSVFSRKRSDMQWKFNDNTEASLGSAEKFLSDLGELFRQAESAEG